MKTKKTISNETIKNIHKKDAKGDIIAYIALSVFITLFVIVGITDSESAPQSLAICLFSLGFIGIIIGVAGTRKKKRASYINETNHKIIEAYLVNWKSIPGSGEGTWYDNLTFYCGEQYGLLTATGGDDATINAQIFGLPILGRSKKIIGKKFYVVLRYSVLNSRYEVSLAFSTDKYELDNELKKTLTVVSEREYEKANNRLGKKTEKK